MHGFGPLGPHHVIAPIGERATGRRAPGASHAVGPIRAYEPKVKQALLNLLANALRFTPEGAASTSGRP